MKAKAAIYAALPKALLVAEVLITLTLVFGLNAFCEDIFPGPKDNAYGRLLDMENYNARCAAKDPMTNSSLQNVRRAAAVAILKGALEKIHTPGKVNGFARDGANQKPYKVALFLNKRSHSLPQ